MAARSLASLAGLRPLDRATPLAFVNTLDRRATGRQVEHLTSYAALLAWSRHHDVIDTAEEDALAAEASHDTASAAIALARALALRETLARIFAAVATGARPTAGDLDALNRALGAARLRLHLATEPTGFACTWEVDFAAGERSPRLERPLWSVARAAADLLASPEITRLRTCANPSCGALFLDRSRAATRRWCDMAGCGNRAKARRHYARRRGSTTA